VNDAAGRPWLDLYRPSTPAGITPEDATVLEMWRSTVERGRDRTLLRYFDGAMTVAEVDRQSDALAVGLAASGFGPGDRLAVFLQNVPAYLIVLLGTWKAGGIVVPVNPMNKAAELAVILADSQASVLVCHPGLYQEVAVGVLGQTAVERVLVSSELDGQSRGDERLFSGIVRTVPQGTVDLAGLIERHAGESPRDPGLRPDDVAILTYTSGTTGPPKGAMSTHANVVFNAQTYRDWMDLTRDDVILGVAPLFHVTGLVAHLALAMLLGCSLVLAYRFEPEVILEVLRTARPTFTVGSITVFISLVNHARARREDFSSLRVVYSGGAPIAPAVLVDFEARTGVYIHNIYGLTETTSPSHAVPLGRRAPIDDASGALSVGVPIFNTVVRILDDQGEEVPVGQIGELAISGPQVVAGYWRKPDETRAAMGGGELLTGDVGFMDEDGWFYIVDRKKDQINVSGYKVWPREVEDVLYQHESVREAAVVGVPDAYRGETVKAFVSLRPGKTATAEELISFCRSQMAAYKYPRQIEFLDELPKTVSGKLLRRELRARD